MADLPDGAVDFGNDIGLGYRPRGPTVETRYYCVECGERVTDQQAAHLAQGHTVARRLVEVSNRWTYRAGPKKRYGQL